MDLTHFDQDGNAWMVDVSDKDITTRTAVAEGFIAINDAIYERIEAGTIKKGDVLSVAHLSSQFRSVTGMTPTQFRFMKTAQRANLDEVGMK